MRFALSLCLCKGNTEKRYVVKKLILIFLILTSAAFAGEKVTIEADNIDTPEQSVFHAKGNVKIFQGEKTLLADEVYYNKDNSVLKAYGNVHMTDQAGSLDCTEMEYDTDNETGTFLNARAFFPPYNWITADKMERKSPLTYSFKDVSFTTCDGKVPDWSFKATDADISVGGYMSSWNTTARIKDFPYFYAPYFIYPVKTERETGFLVPNAGYNSRFGPFIQPKFFWNIDVDQDATFSALLPANAPTLDSVEHRYKPNRLSDVYSYIMYTDDEKRYPTHGEDGLAMNTDPGRFLIYNKSQVALADNLYFRAYIDNVSDYEFINDYQKYSLFEDYKNDTEAYKTTLSLYYMSPYSNITLAYVDSMEYNIGTYYDKEHTYSAPRVTFDKTFTGLPVYVRYFFGYDSVRYTRYRYLYGYNRNYMTDLQYDREHLGLSFYKPVSLYVGTLTPMTTIYETRWHNYNYGYMPKGDYKSDFAEVTSYGDTIRRRTYSIGYSFKLNEIYKQYNGFKHSIYNTFSYKQIPRLDQRYVPNYIYSDSILWTNEYLYTLSNYFTAKDWSVILKNSQVYDMTRNTDRYDEFISDLSVKTKPIIFRVKHKYNRYIKDANYLLTYMKLDFDPVSLEGTYVFDRVDYGSEDNNTTANFSIVYQTKKYDFQYTREASGMNRNLSWGDLTDAKDTFLVTYKKDCWAFGLGYIRETNGINVDINEKKKTEHSIMFTVTLRGLGEYKSSLRVEKKEEEVNPDEM